ncbi:sulfatase [Methylobacterium sp. C33D]
MTKRDLLRGVAIAALLGISPALRAQPARRHQAPADAAKRLNLLFITVDDMDVSIPGFMGNTAGLTPHLDALAARSHCFANNRTVVPICMPSREAFMSGLLPQHSGGTGFVPMKQGTPTLTSILRDEGYYTAASHKISHMRPASSFPWLGQEEGTDRHPLVHAAAFQVAMMEAEAQGKPFFVQCNINDPHRPFYGSPQAARKDHGQQGVYQVAKPVTAADVTIPPNLDDLPKVREEVAQYWNSAQRMDVAIGHILDALQESGHAGNTLVVFMNDHGMPFPFAKATCYDHGSREPVLLCWPGMGPPKRFDNRTTNVDLLPTLLEILGIETKATFDGRSWAPILRGETVPDPEFVVTYVNEVSNGMAYPSRGLQDARWSLIFNAWSDGKLALRLESMGGLTFPAMEEAAKTDPAMAARVKQYVYGVPLALYDLQEDPGQRRNLIDDARHAARVARMQTALRDEMRRTGDPQLANYEAALAGRPMSVPQDPERIRALACTDGHCLGGDHD